MDKDATLFDAVKSGVFLACKVFVAYNTLIFLSSFTETLAERIKDGLKE